MKLSKLLTNVKPIACKGDVDIEIKGVNIDSRKIENGHLFIAMKGTQVDGHKFISKAIELGAVAILLEDMPEVLDDKVTYIQVASTEEDAGKVATMFYGDPSHKLKLVGVTGTMVRRPLPPYYIGCSESSVIRWGCSLRYVTISMMRNTQPVIPHQTP